MLKNILKHLDYYLFPMVSAWVVLLLIHGIHCLYLLRIIPFNNLIYLFLVPLALVEFSAAWHCHKKTRRLFKKSGKWGPRLGLAGNLIFWFFCFYIWVIFLASIIDFEPGVIYYGPRFYLFAIMLWRSVFWCTVLGVVFWLAVYYLVSVRYRRFRLLTAVVIPVAVTFLLFRYQFKSGGTGGCNLEEVLKQPGVAQIVSPADIKAGLLAVEPSQRRLLQPTDSERKRSDIELNFKYHPRGIILDTTENALFLFQGCTYCTGKTYSPSVIKKDLSTGELSFLLAFENIRQVWSTDSSIFVAPWMNEYIYEISKRDLSIINSFPCRAKENGIYWEPMSLMTDTSDSLLYVGNEIHPMLLKYTLPAGDLAGILDLQKLGLAGEGGIAYHMVKSEKTGMIYFIGAPGKATLFELDPGQFNIIRSLKLDDVVGTALVLDDSSGKLYYQSAFYNTIYAVDTKTFQVVRKYRGEFHARRIRLDKKRNAMYVLGYTSGTVFALDLDSGKRLWKLRVGGRPHGMRLSGDTLWIHSMLGAFRLDLEKVGIK